MTIPALEILFYIMDIFFEPGGDIPVTAPAVDGPWFDFPGHVTAQVGNVRMAAGTCISAVRRGFEACLKGGLVMT